ncbi:hypothetical protein [Vibrio sp. MA40-2]|uniref:hypothetical protein n=1 Tax=Vibrio sp. MA40-2 TaxID=3391828 RepID=UPI0039A7340B
MSCKELYAALKTDSYKSTVNVGYKLEAIVDSDKNIIGYECLVNLRRMSVDNAKYLFDIDFNLPFVFLNLLKRISNELGREVNEKTELLSLLENRKLFMNIERSCVCNRIIVNEIIQFKNYLKTLHIDLIIEVTEREVSVCWACREITSGLIELSNNKVNLAADDYDIYNGDFRVSELHIYNYVKIEMPTNEDEYHKLTSFLKVYKNKVNIILERIESQEEFNRICSKGITANLKGYQGFTFGKSLELKI